ncbi:hypothetical protein [Amycolatopsis solani]|uniref:hypothetical protein n=1 Tax=Amycolatopsis solani TaxID=3028615 RepID=UPI0025B0DF23|nr:hypothetical protein [Amycolatopsis sp. MEP2-6]
MRKTVFEVGAAAAAGIITYIVSTAIGTLNSFARWGLVILIAATVFALTWLMARKESKSHPGDPNEDNGIQIGNRVSTEGDLLIDKIDVAPGDANIAVGNDVNSKGKATLSRITVGRKRSKK